MSKPLDLTGQKFGMLTAIRIVGSTKTGQKLWECKCDCGNTTTVISTNLNRDHTRSCGCENHRAKDITGQKFGKLLVIQLVKEKANTKKRSARWLCHCDCGRETVVDANALRTGNTSSCGDCSWGWYDTTGDYVIGHFEDGATMLIDHEDYEMVRQHRWWVEKNTGYFMTNINGKCIHLHRMLMPDQDGVVCDHINRNKCDNRRSNLRYATPKENSRNRSKAKNNTTGYIGVYWHIRKMMYTAQVTTDGKIHNLGYFATAEEAARARDKAARFFYGEFANLNFKEGENESGNSGVGKAVHASDIAI